MRPVVLDTDISSQILKKRLPNTLATKLINTQPVITFVTRAELTKWTEVRNWGSRNRELLAQWMAGVPMIPGDEDVADTYGISFRSRNMPRATRPMNDMWIAVCCITHGLPLATLNIKDFNDFKVHHGLELITT